MSILYFLFFIYYFTIRTHINCSIIMEVDQQNARVYKMKRKINKPFNYKSNTELFETYTYYLTGALNSTISF